MATDKNKGLFETIKKTVAPSQKEVAIGRDAPIAHEDTTADDFVKEINAQKENLSKHLQAQLLAADQIARQELQQKEEELKQYYETEYRRAVTTLEAKYKESSASYIKDQEAKLQQTFQKEKQKYQNALKDKYEKIAKAALHEREQQLIQQVQQQIAKVKRNENDNYASLKLQHQKDLSQWQYKLDALQQELQQQKHRFKFELENAIISARKEQESITRAEYEKQLSDERASLTKSLEEKYTLQNEQFVESCKQELDIKHRRQLAQALADNEFALKQQFQQELSRNSELQRAKIDLEIEGAVGLAVREAEQKLRAEFALQQKHFDEELIQLKTMYVDQNQELASVHNQYVQELHQSHNKQIAESQQSHNKQITELQQTIIKLEEMIGAQQREFENNSNQLRQQIENSLRSEYESQLKYYQSAEYQEEKLHRLLAEQRENICKQLESENLIVLKHKERDLVAAQEIVLAELKSELEEKFDEDLQVACEVKEQQLRQTITEQFAQQEQVIISDYNAKIEEARTALEYATKQQAMLAEQVANYRDGNKAELIAIQQQHESQTKSLLQKQQQILLEQYSQDLQLKLREQAHKLALEQQVAMRELEQRVLELQAANNAAHNDASAVHNESALRQKHEQELASIRQQITEEYEIAKEQALLKQEQALRAEYEELLERRKDNSSDPIERQIQEELFAQEQELRAKFAEELSTLEASYAQEKQNALENLRQNLKEKYDSEIQRAKAEWNAARLQDLQEHERGLKSILDHELSAAVLKREQEIRNEFQDQLRQLREQESQEVNVRMQQELAEALEQHKLHVAEQVRREQAAELEIAQDELKQQYAIKLQKHLDVLKADLEQEKAQIQLELETQMLARINEEKAQIQAEFDEKMARFEAGKQEQLSIRLEQERKKINLKFAQDKANLIQELSAKFANEKKIAIAVYEDHLRDSLYKEMVKQKEHIQAKFAQAQEIALQDQKRRLESEYKQEIERVKQGYFLKRDPEEFTRTVALNRGRGAQNKVERGVEQLADRILSKFRDHE